MSPSWRPSDSPRCAWWRLGCRAGRVWPPGDASSLGSVANSDPITQYLQLHTYLSQAEHVWGVGLGVGEGKGWGSGKVEWGEGGVAPCSPQPGDPPCSIVRGDQSDTAFLQRFVHQVSWDWWIWIAVLNTHL